MKRFDQSAGQGIDKDFEIGPDGFGIDAAIPRAGAAKHERQPLVLDQAVDLIQQGGNHLHLADDHEPRPDAGRQRRQAFAEPPGRAGEFQQQPRIEQVEAGRIRKLRARQS